jgi:hypothetical protein
MRVRKWPRLGETVEVILFKGKPYERTRRMQVMRVRQYETRDLPPGVFVSPTNDHYGGWYELNEIRLLAPDTEDHERAEEFHRGRAIPDQGNT